MRQTFLSATILLVLITDPLGNIPPLLSILKGVDPKKRRAIIFRECAIAFVVLLLFMLFGQQFLELLKLSADTLKIAGGVILFLIALNMVFPGSGARIADPSAGGQPFIVPIAIPLIAGPSAMVTAMLMAASDPSRMLEWIGSLVIAIVISAIAFLLSEGMARVLGEHVIAAFERLMGLVLAAISVDMLLGGLASYLARLQA